MFTCFSTSVHLKAFGCSANRSTTTATRCPGGVSITEENDFVRLWLGFYNAAKIRAQRKRGQGAEHVAMLVGTGTPGSRSLLPADPGVALVHRGQGQPRRSPHPRPRGPREPSQPLPASAAPGAGRCRVRSPPSSRAPPAEPARNPGALLTRR